MCWLFVAGVSVKDQLAVTRGKMEHLRRAMEERKARRRARREARRVAPYSTACWAVDATAASSSADNAATSASATAAHFSSEPEPVTA
jgi:hypothetical protein